MGRKPGCWGLVLAALLFCTPALGQPAAAAQPLPHHQAPAISFRGGATINVADKVGRLLALMPYPARMV